MDGVLILMVLVMLLVALGFTLGFFWAWSKNRALENRLSAAALNEQCAVAKLALAEASALAERQAWDGERKALEGERAVERKAWECERNALEAAAGEGAALKAEYEEEGAGGSIDGSR
eukprot:964524-Rhodomonas_salina.1